GRGGWTGARGGEERVSRGGGGASWGAARGVGPGGATHRRRHSRVFFVAVRIASGASRPRGASDPHGDEEDPRVPCRALLVRRGETPRSFALSGRSRAESRSEDRGEGLAVVVVARAGEVVE